MSWSIHPDRGVRRGVAPWISSALLLALWLAPRAALAQRALQSSVRLGPEHDDNALRTPERTRADWLTRYFASFDANLPRERGRGVTSFSLHHGGKVFLNERDADMLMTQVSLSRSSGFETWQSGFWRLSLDIKDRAERVSFQDYSRADATLGLGAAPWEGALLEARAGARLFAFKPNPAASSKGATVGLTARQRLPHELFAVAGYGLTQRRFDLPLQRRIFPADMTTTDNDTVFLEAGEQLREDLFHAGFASLAWQGPALLEASYTLSLNRSNSYGQDLLRQNFGLGVTAPLRWELFVAARVELQRTRYDDPILIDANFLIDEDNRNLGTFSLVRALGSGFELELRSSLYLQEFGGQSDYQRRTIMLAVGHQWASDL